MVTPGGVPGLLGGSPSTTLSKYEQVGESRQAQSALVMSILTARISQAVLSVELLQQIGECPTCCGQRAVRVLR
jgi:hypothetical protein